MLQLSDITSAKNNALDLCARKPLNGSSDFSSDAGFFSLLKNQIEPIQQPPTIAIENPENSSRHAIDNNRPAGEDERPKAMNDEKTRADCKAAENPRERELSAASTKTKTHDDTGASAEQIRNVTEKQGTGAPVEKNLTVRNGSDMKTGRNDILQISDLLKNLRNMIDDAARSGAPLQELKQSIKELHDSLRSVRQGPDRARMNAALDTIARLLEKNDMSKTPRLLHQQLAKTMAGMREM
ncbi:MAG: hypothetical protein E4G96_04640, partial [Chrysiogenales bacterium]